MAFRKAANQDFQQQLKEIRLQLTDQIKCLEGRTDTQVSIYHEINDFCKKRADLDQEYAKQLEKLVKSVMFKYKNEKSKRAAWTVHSPCNLFMLLVDDTKEEAKNRAVIADVMGNFATQSISSRCVQLQRINKRCREIGALAQGEILRVLSELNVSMKTYFECFDEAQQIKAKLQMVEEKSKHSESKGKQKSLQKSINKRSEKFDAAKQKCNKARNEYLLCIGAANAALHKFFADDLSDLIDCSDVGTDFWLSLLLENLICARKNACHAEMQSLAQLNEYRQSIASCERQKCDKQRFFESQNNTFMLPKAFEFKVDPTENINRLALEDGLCDDLAKRHQQMRIRLNSLREESEHTSKQLYDTQERIRQLLAQQQALEITVDGVFDHRPPNEAVEPGLEAALDEYTTAFSYFLLNANLIVRLEARADGIERALETFDRSLNTHVQGITRESGDQVAEWHERERRKLRVGVAANSTPQFGGDLNGQSQSAQSTPQMGHTLLEARPSTGSASGLLMKSNFNTLSTNGSETPIATNPQARHGTVHSALTSLASPQERRRCSHPHQPPQRRPRLFGGALEEYVRVTGEQIPLVVTSCVQALAQFALHHQGLFRISGSQVEINRMKEAFEEGDDPLQNIRNASDKNSIAGVLKLYFRELREPVFPFFMFERITDCAKQQSMDDFIPKITDLINKLSPSSYLLLRYLFAFLNHVSRFSDENMMDAYNLAICFGPTLLRIPETKDQVYYQNYVNDVVKNLIVYHDQIFSTKVPGPLYSPSKCTYNAVDNVEQFADDADEALDQGTITPSTYGTLSTLNDNSSTLNLNSFRCSVGVDPCSSGREEKLSRKTDPDKPFYSSSDNSVSSADGQKSVVLVDTSQDETKRRSSLMSGTPVSDGTIIGFHHQARTIIGTSENQLKNQLRVEPVKDDDSGTGGCSPAGKSGESQEEYPPNQPTRPSIDSGIGRFSNAVDTKSQLNKNTRTLDRIRIRVAPKPTTSMASRHNGTCRVASDSAFPSDVANAQSSLTPPSYNQLYSSINKTYSHSNSSSRAAPLANTEGYGSSSSPEGPQGEQHSDDWGADKLYASSMDVSIDSPQKNVGKASV